MRLRLKEMRESQYLSQRDLAKKAGVGEATIVRLEQEKHQPTFQTIRRLAAALGVEPSELVEED